MITSYDGMLAYEEEEEEVETEGGSDRDRGPYSHVRLHIALSDEASKPLALRGCERRRLRTRQDEHEGA